MTSINRRTVLQAALAAVPALALAQAADAQVPEPGVAVAAGKDRFGQERNVFGTLPMTRKVSGQDTGGALLVIEQNNAVKGGPPRHLHHKQDEWFYAIAGEYLVEIGGVQHRLKPGACVLAPRNVPHTWAFVGSGAGKMLVAFEPAGKMEAFFDEATRLTKVPPPAELAALFAAHEMQLVGPPLTVG